MRERQGSEKVDYQSWAFEKDMIDANYHGLTRALGNVPIPHCSYPSECSSGCPAVRSPGQACL